MAIACSPMVGDDSQAPLDAGPVHLYPNELRRGTDQRVVAEADEHIGIRDVAQRVIHAVDDDHAGAGKLRVESVR
ncbi:MAG: hypothetical protein P8X98_17000 [Woeseiaceae bacterium]